MSRYPGEEVTYNRIAGGNRYLSYFRTISWSRVKTCKNVHAWMTLGTVTAMVYDIVPDPQTDMT